ncbi:MAG: hypothetical protein IJD21_06910 [Oscillospiraceae bacterium]|nr:hypothetical protein [Oscillospiraceae bacterium]
MKLNYKHQLILTMVIMLLFNLLNTLFQQWIFTSIGYVLCGLIWVVHPVMIGGATPTEKQILAIRLAGGVLILIGIFTRSYLY